MDQPCNIKEVPLGYKEIYCSSGKSDERAFVCDTGYSNGINGPNDTIIIKQSATPTCNFSKLQVGVADCFIIIGSVGLSE